MKTKFVKDVRGEEIPVPKELEHMIKEIRNITKNYNQRRIIESSIGDLISNTHKKLLAQKDSEKLLYIAGFLNSIGSWNAQFFYEAYYKLNPDKIK